MSENLGLGKIIVDDTQKRDAVHIAVIPVIASRRLLPGQLVGLDNVGEAVPAGMNAPAIGAVDPFLLAPVVRGQKFWLFLNPGSIVSLRHEWGHPSFPEAKDPAADSESMKFMRNFADEVGMSYGALLASAVEFLSTGEGHTLSFDTPDVTYTQADKFWGHLEVITGMRVPPELKADGLYFSCSC